MNDSHIASAIRVAVLFRVVTWTLNTTSAAAAAAAPAAGTALLPLVP
jgi:hypothetical protein